MGGLLHPVGPEEERTYWMRRGLVLIACLAVLAMLGFTVANMNASGMESQPAAAPAPAPALTTAAPVTPSSPEVAAPNGVATPTATPVAGAPAAPAPSPTASATPTATPSATASAGPASPSPSATATPTPATTGRATNKPAPAAVTGPCEPKVLKTVVQGPRSIHASSPAAFKVVVTNSGQQECVVDSDPANYEFKVYSGPARIWSTADCTKTSYQPQRSVVAPGATTTWELNWDVSMSANGCKVVNERLRPGTYVATAQIKNAAPAQLIMILT